MLKESIPQEFAKTKQIKELFEAEQPEMDALRDAFKEWSKELYIFTTQKEIERWENDYCITPDESLTMDQRRMRVFAKKSEKVITKKEYLEEKLKKMLGVKYLSISENNCCLTVYYETDYLVDNLDITLDYFRKVRPAHLGYNFINAINRTDTTDIYIGIAVESKKYYNWEVDIYRKEDSETIYVGIASENIKEFEWEVEA